MLMAATNEALGRALMTGQPAAVGAAWSRFSPMVRRILRKYFGRQEDVEDQIQDLFLILLDNAHTLRNPAALKSFVISIAVRGAAREHRRRRVRGQDLPGEPISVDRLASGVDVRAQHALRRLTRLLEQLSKGERDAFVLRFVEGKRIPDVAAELDISISTARRRFVHAWKRISLLAQCDPFLADFLPQAND
jgi:RNA polymerase sigma-70 factor (ECF subfamily)